MRHSSDKELELYRGILEPAKEFQDGFGWTTVAGIFFCGLIMMPGGIYLGLMTGGSLGTAASWVTVILFMEIARRAMRPMSRQQLVILLHAATIMMMAHVMMPGGPLGWLVYRAYLVGSDAVRDAGMTGAFPSWFCPPADSAAITERTFFHKDWLVPIGLVLFTMVDGTGFEVRAGLRVLPAYVGRGAVAVPAGGGERARGDGAVRGGRSGRSIRGPAACSAEAEELRWQIFSLGATLGGGVRDAAGGGPGDHGTVFVQAVLPDPVAVRGHDGADGIRVAGDGDGGGGGPGDRVHRIGAAVLVGGRYVCGDRADGGAESHFAPHGACCTRGRRAWTR